MPIFDRSSNVSAHFACGPLPDVFVHQPCLGVALRFLAQPGTQATLAPSLEADISWAVEIFLLLLFLA